MQKQTKKYPHEFIFKATWRNTALTIKVEATNLKQAELRAEGMVSRMEGGDWVETIELVRQSR